jgi:septal ring factor EnvC (AmiA/AmiB activator)
MKRVLIFSLLILGTLSAAVCQTKKDLEEQRNKTLEEISYVDKLLKETEKEKKASLSELKIIGKKLNLRESMVKGLQDEILLLGNRIDLNNLALTMMEGDLIVLKKDYEKTVLSSFRSSKGNSELGYILSAKDFNQGYKRMKYLQQITKFRRQESEIIQELKSEIEVSKRKMESDLSRVSELKAKEEQQKSLLQGEQNRKQSIVKSLSSKEAQLQRDLEEKKRIAKRIEREISRIIDEERKKNVTSDLTPEQKLISNDFYENKGRLPWPVERGVITSHYGLQKHAVLKYVTEDNIDIEITSSGLTPVRSVFRGEVKQVFSIRGENMAIMISHGKYFTVYLNIVNVKVKKGDKVVTKQEIGKVFSDSENGDKAILKFMVFEDKVKLDPELWISKKN